MIAATTTDGFARGLAVAALAVSLVGLVWTIGWSIFTWRWTGFRVTLDAEYLIWIYPGVRKAQCLVLTCRNRGRAAVGMSKTQVNLYGSKPPPFVSMLPAEIAQVEGKGDIPTNTPSETLLASHSATWVVEVVLDSYQRMPEGTCLVRATVELGSGKSVKAQPVEVRTGPIGLD